MNTVFVLWNPESDKAPKVRFYTFESAKLAAEQMAERHPGQTFHVLESRGSVVKNAVQWTFPEKIPF